MSITTLTAKRLKELTCPPGKSKENFWDASCKGLMLEIRASGGRTWYLRYVDARSKPRQLRMGDAADISLDQARKRADELRGQIALGKDPAEEKAILKQVPTFAEFVQQRYLPFVKSYKRSWQTDECLLRNHLLPAFGTQYLDQIKKDDVVALHHARLAGGAAKGSANRLLILMRYIFNMALRWEIPGITKNPTADVPLFEDPPMKERFLTQEEARRLYEAVKDSDNTMLQFIVPMLILTGARRREALDAKWEDFDIPRRQWRIPMTKTGKPRHVPLSDGALQILASVPHFDNCPWVFPNPKTLKPFVGMFSSWDTARTKAGLADVKMHDLRHSFASFLVNAGRSLYEVQKILGHTQVKTTQRYAHLAQETLIDAANAAVNSLGNAFMPATTVPLPALQAA